MILEIERAWGKAPGWFCTLDPETQADLFGWQRVHMFPQKPSKGPRAAALSDSKVKGPETALAWLAGD